MTATVEPTLETLSDRARGLLQGAVDIHVHADPGPVRGAQDRLLDDGGAGAGGGVGGARAEESRIPHAAAGVDARPRVQRHRRVRRGRAGLGRRWAEPGGGRSHAAHRRVGWCGCRPSTRRTGGATVRGASTARRMASPSSTRTARCCPVCHDILDVIASHNAVLASGHLSPEETAPLLGEALSRGMRCVITHASFWTPVELQQEIVSKGGYIEQCAIAVAGEDGEEAWPDLLRQVREGGAGAGHPVVGPRAGVEPGARGGAGALRGALRGGGIQRGGGGADAVGEPEGAARGVVR